jgi:glyoxylase-like metal-dependent hydrolase (beta-lactamase superfamily II)
MKNVHPFLLAIYILTVLTFIIGLLWPIAFRTFNFGKKDRMKVLKILGIPSTVLFIAFYFSVIFHIQDLPIILGALSGLSFILAVMVCIKPKLSGKYLIEKSRVSRFFIFAIPGVFLLILMFFSTSVIENYRVNQFKETEERRLQIIQNTKKNISPLESNTVKVYPLHIGDTILTYGQFYGGLKGWEGLVGYFYTLINKDTITVPLYSYLIDHPKHGLIMIDSCINWEQAHDHDGYYNHNYMISRLLSDRNEYKLTPEQELEVQVELLGYKLDDIKTVFMTHVHDDHAGGLRNLPHAKVVLNKEDWEKGTLYPYSFDLVKENLQLFTYSPVPFQNFTGSFDYFGDNSVILLPTQGHSPGHTAVLLNMENSDALFVGDTPYTLHHMAVDQVRQMTIGGLETDKQVKATRNIQQLVDANPETILLFSHDHTDYQSKMIKQTLLDGTFSTTEVNKIKEYRSNIFNKKWKLKSGNMPYYIPPTNKRGTGSVGLK